jgi:hypothetical protein
MGSTGLYQPWPAWRPTRQRRETDTVGRPSLGASSIVIAFIQRT